MSKQLIVNTKNSTKSITLKSLLISRKKKLQYVLITKYKLI